MFLTKEELAKEDKYSLLSTPVSRLTHWFTYEPIPTCQHVDIDDFIKNNSGTSIYNKCNDYIAVRGSGDMFTYDKEFVVITITSVFKPEEVVNKKKFKEHFYIRVYFHTIDKYGRGLVLKFKNKNDYIKQIERIKIYLYQHPTMENDDDFNKYWTQFDDVLTDFC